MNRHLAQPIENSIEELDIVVQELLTMNDDDSIKLYRAVLKAKHAAQDALKLIKR